MNVKEFIIPKTNPESAIIRAQDFIEKLPHDKAWLVRVQPYKSSRSEQQNRTYWMWLHEIAESSGHTSDELHEFCRAQFMPRTVVQINGISRGVAQSTTKLSIDEMSSYMERVQQLAAELGIQLTQPEHIL